MSRADYHNEEIQQTEMSRGKDNSLFTEQYIALRQQEKRIYTDDEVSLLPNIAHGHIHESEWKIRRHSCTLLVKYLRRKRAGEIVEVGCGNGWLSHKLSEIPGCKVRGMDINEVELEQAARVFSGTSNLKFTFGDLDYIEDSPSVYDYIVFAASIQYFNSLSRVIQVAKNRLRTNGEIHILDSPFYSVQGITDARQRSKEYFARLGFDEMQKHYFHHTIDALQEFKYSILYNPHSVKNRLLKRNPFPWIRIIK